MTRLLVFLLLSLLPSVAQAALSCPNKPVGSTTITTNPFDSFVVTGWGNSSPSLHSIVTNQDGPSSPPNALQAFYPTGHEGGYGTGNTYFTPGTGYSDLYVCVAVKVDSPFQTHPNGTKVLYISGPWGSTHPFFIHLFGSDPTYGPGYGAQASGAVDNRHISSCFWPGSCSLFPSSYTFTQGTWHTLEAYVKDSTTTTSQDGIAKLWIDGTQTVNIENLNTELTTFAGVKINPVYGGGTGVFKLEDDYMWFDEILIAAGGGTPPPPPPPPPPGPPPPPPSGCNCNP